MKKCAIKFLNKINPNPKIIEEEHFLFNADCLKILRQIPNNSIKLVITDPPYNINLKYNSYKDNLSWPEYYQFLEDVLKEIYRILTNDGSLYLVNYPELNARTLPTLENKIGFIFKRWLTWHYPTNIGHSKSNFTRSQRSILFMTKSKKHFFNKPIQPYKNPEVSKIKKLIKAGKKGRGSYDALEVKDLIEIFGKKNVERDLREDFLYYNLLKNVSKDRAIDKRDISKEEKIKHPCQLPLSLLKLFINSSSKKGEIVLDAFAGTFTTNKAAKDLGRLSIGIEIDKKYVKFGVKRLKNG